MALYFDFNGILTVATLLMGGGWVVDRLLFKKKREALAVGHVPIEDPKLVEYACAFFPVLLAVLVLRMAIVEPFRIPSGSMKPTLLEGEFILVNKYTYGVRLPLTGSTVLPMNKPKRGEVMVFRSPRDVSINYIKRVIGLPGDVIEYREKILYINNEAQEQDLIGKDFDTDPNGYAWRVQRGTENLSGVLHPIFVRPKTGFDMPPVTVPEGHYFMMGDNRDVSEDSRVWGFVDEKLIIGKAFYIWMSWDNAQKEVRWDRLGTTVS